MKQVYQCDFCCETHEIQKVMERHEKLCVFNPENIPCYSCEHQFNSIYDSSYECKINHKFFRDVREGYRKCEVYKPEGKK